MNARKEILDILNKINKNTTDIKYASIRYDWNYDENSYKNIKLSSNHNNIQLNQFLLDLDFEYDNGFGLQELFGYIVFNDNTWLSRHEYDGSENWEYNHCPEEEL